MASYRLAVAAESGGPLGSHGESHPQGKTRDTPLLILLATDTSVTLATVF